MDDPSCLIAVVGPCTAGKSTLVEALRRRGYNAREVAQEHSYVPAMWERITRPDLLIYLDVSWPIARQRRPSLGPESWWRQVVHRLRHARERADLTIDTDNLTPEQVQKQALAFLTGVPTPRLT